MTDIKRNDMMELYEGNEPYVFISYSHKDLDKISPVIDWLKENNYRIWYDNGIHPGTDWPDVVAGRLNDSTVFLAFVSANYLASQNCTRELHFAVSKRKQLLTIYLDNAEVPLGVEMQLCTSQAIRMHDYKGKTFYQVLSNADVMFQCRIEEVKEEPVAPAPSNAEATAWSEQLPGKEKKREDALQKEKSKKEKTEKKRASEEGKHSKEKNKRGVFIGIAAAVVVLIVILICKLNSNVSIAGEKYPKNLTILKLNGVVLEERDMLAIAKMKKLSSLNLTGCDIRTDFSSGISNCQNISSLQLTDCTGIGDLSFVDNLKLYTLKLDNIDIKEADFNCQRNERLTSLTVCNAPSLTKDDFVALFPKVYTLDLHGDSLTETDDIALLKELKELNLEDNRLTTIDDDFWSLELSRLYLSGNKISSTQGLQNLTVLREFTFAGNQSEGYVSGSLDFLKKSSAKLSIVDLSDNGIDYDTMTDLLKACTLTEVNISNNPLGSASRSADLKFLSGSKVIRINAEGCGIDSVKGLCANFNKLKYADLSDNFLTDVFSLCIDDSYPILDLRNNKLKKCNSIPQREYDVLLLNGNPISEFDLGKISAITFSVDYNDFLKPKDIDSVSHKLYVAKVPLDKRVNFKENSTKTIIFGTIDIDGTVFED